MKKTVVSIFILVLCLLMKTFIASAQENYTNCFLPSDSSTFHLFDNNIREVINQLISMNFDESKYEFKKKDENTKLINKEAIGWTERFLSPYYIPSKDSEYIFLSGKVTNVYDKLKLHYRVNNKNITIVQMRYIFGMLIENDGLLSIEELNALFISIFSNSQFLKLKTLFSNNNQVIGTTVYQVETSTPWLNGLIWCQNKDCIALYFIKYDGEPSKIVKKMYSDSNKNWFSNK
jgi:hypothetical protein